MSSAGISPAVESDEERARNGLIAALGAYLLWGIFPVYFKFVQDIPPLEVLAHRIVWAVPFGALIIAFRKQWREVLDALRNRRTFGFLVLSSLLIAVNWFVYIVAVQNDQVFQASLGYYINPLINVVVGVLFFAERLRRLQTGAVLLAATGVTVLATGGDGVPWVSLALAASFTCYAVIRKQVAVGGMPGLFVETLLLVPVGLIYLAMLMADGSARFLAGSGTTDVLLLLAGPFTVIPLLFFALAARRLMLTTIGMLQFMAPSIQFCVGVFYGEVLTLPHIICFGFIWSAIALFIWDALRESRRIQVSRGKAAT